MKKLVSLVLALIMVLSMGMAMAEEPIKIRWAMGCGGTAPVDAAKGQEALNKLLREKINVEVEIQYFTEDQLMNSINTGEVFDIYFTCDWYFNTNQATSDGLFLDVAEAVKTVTPELYASMSEGVWELAKTPDGGLYAIPNQKDYAAINLITYPVEKAKELGFEMPESIAAWSELTPFLEAWKATLPEGEYPVLIGGAARGLESSFDFIDRVALIGCVYGTTDVVTVFEDPEIMERYRALADWYAKGLINPDAALITETAIDTSKERIDMVQAWPGYDYSPSNGYPTAMIRYAGPNLNVAGVQGSMQALSVALEDDTAKRDAALKVIELAHIDQEVANILRFGEEGYHWNYVDAEKYPELAGCVQRTQAGSDNYSTWAFAWPANFITSFPVTQGMLDGVDAPPVMDQYENYYKLVAEEAKVSAMGSFKMDTSRWTDAIAEMTAIKDEYFSDFATGTRSIDDVYEEFIAKMNAAGLQEMIADAQAQLDAYLGK